MLPAAAHLLVRACGAQLPAPAALEEIRERLVNAVLGSRNRNTDNTLSSVWTSGASYSRVLVPFFFTCTPFSFSDQHYG